MRSKRFNMTTTQTKVGALSGGVKDSRPQLELNMGDLIRGLNYQEVDGQYHGYRSLPGYEVYDGTQLASDVVVPVTDVDGVITYDDIARETRRSAITKVGGTLASGPVVGCFQDDGYVIAARNNAADTFGKLWRTTEAGWVAISESFILYYTDGNKNAGTKIKVGQTITAAGAGGTVTAINTESGSWDLGTAVGSVLVTVTSGTFTSGVITGSLSGTATYTSGASTIKKGGKYKFTQGRFDLFPGLQRKKITFLASTSYYPSYIDNGVVIPIISNDLPDNKATDLFATSIIEFKNRLWLGYPDGRLVFSNVGNPLDFDPTTFSGVINMEDEIVDLQITTGDVLVVMCKNSIQLVKALSVGDATDGVVADYLFSNSTLTSNIGCTSNTAHRIFDDLIYIDDRGLTSLESTQKFGDFETKSYSKSIQRTLSLNLPNVVGSYVDNIQNQYRLLFSDGFGIIFTFSMTSNKGSTTSFKTVKGATTFRYLVNITSVGEKIFGSDNGFIYKIDSGTSFNGFPIDTLLTTCYYHYQSPTVIKRFREVVFEGSIPISLEFLISASFDYKDTKYIKSAVQDELVVPSWFGGIYGDGRYDVIRYGSSEYQTSVYYVASYGTSMSISLRTSNKYVEPHTLSSMITQYTLNGRKM